MPNAKQTPVHDSSLIEMHDILRNGETDCHKISKLTVRQQWWKHACHSSPSCLRPPAATRQAFFSFHSFHPATNTVTTLLTYKKTSSHPPHPAWKKRPVSSQPAKGPELRVRLHPSAECCCCSSEACPAFLAIDTHTDRWNMLLRSCAGCRVTDSHVLLPSSLPRSPCPPRY